MTKEFYNGCVTKQLSFPLLGLLVLGLGIFGFFNFRKSLVKPTEIEPAKSVATIKIELPEAAEGLIPLDYTCEGAGVSPELKLSGISKGTKSLAIIVDDKDATIGTFTHWLVWNIDPFMKTVKRGETPSEATVGKNSYGKFEWGAICPPPGPMHHYRFKVYALSDYLDLPVEETKPADLVKATKKLLVGYGEITALFGK